MDESSARSRGRAIEDARARMVEARSAAVAASAPALASAAYGAAVAAEREAGRLQKAGRASDAAVKYYEASGLFRSAEVAARTVPPARGQRAAAQNEQSAPAATPATPPKPALPPETVASPATAKATPPDTQSPTIAVTPPAPASTPLPLPAPPQPAPTAPPVQTPPPAVQTPPPAQPAPNAAPSPDSLIREVLTRYESALEARSMEALKRIWPSLAGNQQSSIRTEFEQARSIEVDVVNPQISVSGASATATFVRHYEFQPKNGTPLRADTLATMTLRRTDGGGWVIEQIQFGAAR